MQKKEFRYRKLSFILVWMLIIGSPVVWFVPEALERIEGAAYYIMNILITIAVVFVVWRLTNVLPGIQRKGFYWKEDGKTALEYGRKTIVLDSVTELFLTDKHVASRGINLLIRNGGVKIEFLSETLEKGVGIEDTAYYNIYSQILAENPQLQPVKDIWGEDTDYWHKA